MSSKFDYITVAPLTPKGKWNVCVRRVGSRDRFAPVALCNTQLAADSIVDAMNLMQGEVKKLEAPAQRLLEQVRADLKMSQDRCRTAETERSGLNHRLREEQRNVDRVTQERNIAQAKLTTAETYLEQARKELTEFRAKMAASPGHWDASELKTEKA